MSLLPEANLSLGSDAIEQLKILLRLTFLTEKLLRLRKDLPTTLTIAIAQGQWEEWVKPLFKDDQIVHQQLVKIGPGRIIEKLNEELHLREVEHTAIGRNPDLRPVKRQGVYLANDEHGLLITDMTPGIFPKVFTDI